jgi:hypothetical protein
MHDPLRGRTSRGLIDTIRGAPTYVDAFQRAPQVLERRLLNAVVCENDAAVPNAGAWAWCRPIKAFLGCQSKGRVARQTFGAFAHYLPEHTPRAKPLAGHGARRGHTTDQ